jgi:hypothetical protein
MLEVVRFTVSKAELALKAVLSFKAALGGL